MKNIVKFILVVASISVICSCNKNDDPPSTQVYWEVEKDIKYPLWDLYSQQGYDNILYGEIINRMISELWKRGFQYPDSHPFSSMYIRGLNDISEGEALVKEATDAVLHEYYGKKLFTYTGERSATINVFISHINGKNSEYGKHVCSLTFY